MKKKIKFHENSILWKKKLKKNYYFSIFYMQQDLIAYRIFSEWLNLRANFNFHIPDFECSNDLFPLLEMIFS